jgi:hypothetical protein
LNLQKFCPSFRGLLVSKGLLHKKERFQTRRRAFANVWSRISLGGNIQTHNGGVETVCTGTYTSIPRDVDIPGSPGLSNPYLSKGELDSTEIEEEQLAACVSEEQGR